jgi:hypothetical protein
VRDTKGQQGSKSRMVIGSESERQSYVKEDREILEKRDK